MGLTAADLGIVAALLSGAVRAMLLSVDFNVREMRSDKQFSDAITAERRELELEANSPCAARTQRRQYTLLPRNTPCFHMRSVRRAFAHWDELKS